MAACDEAGTSGEGRKDKEHGGDISAFVTDQRVSDCGFLLAKVEGRGYEGDWIPFLDPSP